MIMKELGKTAMAYFKVYSGIRVKRLLKMKSKSVRIASNWTKIRTWFFPSTNLQSCSYTDLLVNDVVTEAVELYPHFSNTSSKRGA
jgi:hypothetical protein